MKVRCIYNTGEIFSNYLRKPLGVSNQTEYGGLEIDKEYLVLGMILCDGFLSYLIHDGVATAYHTQLFDITDNSITPNWYFKEFTIDSGNYTNIEAVWGYYELVFDDSHYWKLVEIEEDAQRIYFRRKIELEKWLEDQEFLK